MAAAAGSRAVGRQWESHGARRGPLRGDASFRRIVQVTGARRPTADHGQPAHRAAPPPRAPHHRVRAGPRCAKPDGLIRGAAITIAARGGTPRLNCLGWNLPRFAKWTDARTALGDTVKGPAQERDPRPHPIIAVSGSPTRATPTQVLSRIRSCVGGVNQKVVTECQLRMALTLGTSSPMLSVFSAVIRRTLHSENRFV